MLLDRFWQARGVHDVEQRRRLIDAVAQSAEKGRPRRDVTTLELPGANTAWLLDGELDTQLQVEEVSAWVLQMQSLLGSPADADVVKMVVREPRLLSADMRQVANRLLDMKIAAGALGTDILKAVEAQPALLLQDGSLLDDEETADERAQAWHFGLVSDGAREWARRAHELADYRQAKGDAHVGFRTGDAPELARWAAKQRADHAAGTLSAERAAALHALAFEFDEAAAEWGRWFAEVRAAADEGSSPAYGSSEALLLTNWCSVQRIAKRAGVLSQQRIEVLDSIQFNWSGADALS